MCYTVKGNLTNSLLCLQRMGAQPMHGQIQMLTSGKGGTGKTTLTALLGAALAARGHRVLVVELSGGPRTMDYVAAVAGQTVYDLGDVCAGRCAPEKAVVSSAVYKGLFVICAPCGGDILAPQRVIDALLHLRAQYDTILLDTGSGLGVPFAAACAVADSALIVVTPDSVSVRDGCQTAEALREASIPARLLLNRVPPALQGTGVTDLDACIDGVGAQLIGVVPFSTKILCAAATGTPPAKESHAARALHAIAARLCGEYTPLVIH